MRKKRILFVVGTRPDTIKMAPLYKELKGEPSFDVMLCSSGQHSQLLNQALDVFSIIPDFELRVMKERQTLSDLTSVLLKKFTELFSETKPDLVLVHGDTTTAFIGALSAFYLKIPVGHVESGLRTNDLNEPFPEELYRQSIARIARWNFTPTNIAYRNLLAEGIPESKIFLTGNTIIDSVKYIRDKIANNENYKKDLEKVSHRLFHFSPKSSNYILVTLHRRESFGIGIENICKALKAIAVEHPEIFILLPMHLNPEVRNHVINVLSEEKNIVLVNPINYDLFIYLIMNCKFIVTDSGGIQEEAVTLSKKVLVTRNKTEREEGLSSGFLQVVSTDYEAVYAAVKILVLDDSQTKSLVENPFGEGDISKCIKDIIIRDLL
jgi:UDP-N-acetylglucosamine 2-epimerase (non-hydrolysing)